MSHNATHWFEMSVADLDARFELARDVGSSSQSVGRQGRRIGLRSPAA